MQTTRSSGFHLVEEGTETMVDLSPKTNDEVVLLKRERYMQTGASIMATIAYCRKPTPFHIHDFYEIAVITEGYGGHVYGTVYEDLSQGDVLFINPSVPHRYLPAESTVLTCVTIAFTESVFDGIIDDQGISELVWLFFAAGHGADRRVPRIRLAEATEPSHARYLLDVVQRVLSEYQSKKPGYLTILRGHLLVLLTELWRLYPFDLDEDIGSATWQRLLPALQTLYKENQTVPNIAALASGTGWSPSHFSKLFRQATGQSPREFALQQRAQRAASLLITTDDSIDSIAERTGYGSARSLRRAFVKCFGLTPSDYRRIKRQSDTLA